jgi:hypothetical protein
MDSFFSPAALAYFFIVFFQAIRKGTVTCHHQHHHYQTTRYQPNNFLAHLLALLSIVVQKPKRAPATALTSGSSALFGLGILPNLRR